MLMGCFEPTNQPTNQPLVVDAACTLPCAPLSYTCLLRNAKLVVSRSLLPTCIHVLLLLSQTAGSVVLLGCCAHMLMAVPTCNTCMHGLPVSVDAMRPLTLVAPQHQWPLEVLPSHTVCLSGGKLSRSLGSCQMMLLVC